MQTTKQVKGALSASLVLTFLFTSACHSAQGIQFPISRYTLPTAPTIISPTQLANISVDQPVATGGMVHLSQGQVDAMLRGAEELKEPPQLPPHTPILILKPIKFPSLVSKDFLSPRDGFISIFGCTSDNPLETCFPTHRWTPWGPVVTCVCLPLDWGEEEDPPFTLEPRPIPVRCAPVVQADGTTVCRGACDTGTCTKMFYRIPFDGMFMLVCGCRQLIIPREIP